MEGAIYTAMELFLAQGLVGLVSALRFYFVIHKKAKYNYVDVGLLVLQIASFCGAVFIPALAMMSPHFTLIEAGSFLSVVVALFAAQIMMLFATRAAVGLGKFAWFFCEQEPSEQPPTS